MADKVTRTLNISLPDALMSFVKDQLRQRHYNTRSEYVRALIHKDQERQRLCGFLKAGAASGPTAPVDDDYFESLRRRVRTVRA